MRQTPNTDDTLFNVMIALKRHLGSCRECSAAIKANDPYLMCRAGIFLVIGGAKRFDGMISLRRDALKSRQHTIFACPDLSKHGKSYALMAPPYVASAVQGGLW